jgi:hypothetical protein
VTYLSHHSEAGHFRSFAKWLGTNLIAYVSGAIIFGIGFLVFAALYVYFVPTPAVIPTQAPVQTAPEPVAPSFKLPSKPTDKLGPIAEPRFELPVPVAKLADQDLLGKKLVDPQGVSLGYITSIHRDAKGEITSLGLQDSQKPEPGAPVIKINIAPTR